MSRLVNSSALEHSLALARLELPSERYEPVKAAAELVYGLADSLDAVDLDEVPIATAFDARWE